MRVGSIRSAKTCQMMSICGCLPGKVWVCRQPRLLRSGPAAPAGFKPVRLQRSRHLLATQPPALLHQVQSRWVEPTVYQQYLVMNRRSRSRSRIQRPQLKPHDQTLKPRVCLSNQHAVRPIVAPGATLVLVAVAPQNPGPRAGQSVEDAVPVLLPSRSRSRQSLLQHLH